MHARDGLIHIGQVDAVANDGSVNITLNDGTKVNAKPHQVEQANAVARLDGPPGSVKYAPTPQPAASTGEKHDAANTPDSGTATLDRPTGSAYLRPATTGTYDALGDDERARLLRDLQSNSGLDEATAQRVVDQLDTLRQRYGIRVGGVGKTTDLDGKHSNTSTAFVTQDGFLAFDPAQANDQELGGRGGYNATKNVEELVTHEMTHMLQFGFSDRGAASWKYATSAANHHIEQKYFKGDHLAYVKARGEVSGYALQDANGHEAEAEMLATYLHHEDAPPWLVEWGDTVSKIHNSNIDFSEAWGYGSQVNTPAHEIDREELINFDDPGVLVQPWSEIGNPGWQVPGYVDDWSSDLELHPGNLGSYYVMLPDENGVPQKTGPKTASLIHYLRSKDYKVVNGWDGAPMSVDFHSGWSPAALRFADEENMMRFLRETGLNANFFDGNGTYPLQQVPVNGNARGAMALVTNGNGDDVFQVAYNPLLLGQIPNMIQNHEFGYNPDLPPVPEDVAREIGLPDIPVQKPGELDAVTPRHMGETGQEAAKGPSHPAASIGLQSPEVDETDHLDTATELYTEDGILIIGPMRPATPEDRARLKVPPGWKDVMVAEKPEAELQVKGRDSKNRAQSRYSDAHWDRVNAIKFARMQALHELLPQLDAALDHDAGIDEAATAVYLMRVMGVRNGSEKDTGAKTFAYGATNLRARHVLIDGENVTLDFDAKDNVHLTLPVTDERLKQILRDRVEGKNPDDRLFNTNEQKTNAYLKSQIGDEFKVKDLRTYFANAQALAIIMTMAKPQTAAEFKKSRMDVARQVSKLLGNTPSVLLKSYLNPTIFNTWLVDAPWLDS